MPTHADLLDRHRAVLPSWLGLYYDEPLELVRGEGRHVWDGEGNRYLDFFGGILTTMTGHNVPEVVAAVREQAGRILHTSTVYMIRPMVELAERIAGLAPIPDAKVFFVSSGTEAVEAALLLATNARRSSQILALRNSYHGRSFAAMASTGNRSWSPSSLTPVTVSYVHNGDRYRSPFAGLPAAEFTRVVAEDVREVIETTTAGDVACMIAEPIQGVGGFVTPPDGFFAALKEVLDDYGILFVSDEVQTGWGRTGDHFWGIQAHDVIPDIMIFAKGLGNGLAIGGVVAGAELMDTLEANSISTFGGNPIATAAALANLDVLRSQDLQGNASRVGAHLRRKLDELPARCPEIGEVRGRGLMIGIEVVHAGTRQPDPDCAEAIMEEARRRGVLVGKGGLYGNVLRIAPPLSVTSEEAGNGADAIVAAVEAASRRRAEVYA